MRVLALVVLLVEAAVAVAMPASMARAEWAALPTEILNSPDQLAPLVACPDANSGSFLFWQIATGAGGPIRAQHVLEDGTLDPNWPVDGAILVPTIVQRTRMEVIPDGLGGAYVWWIAAGNLYVVRMNSGGSVAAGWPAEGKRLLSIGTTLQSAPCVIADGEHGLYAASGPGLKVVHVSSDNTSGAWPQDSVFVPGTPSTIRFWPQLAPTPDGGVFLAWSVFSVDSLVAPSTFRVTRFTRTGSIAPGWAPSGFRVATYDHWQLEGVFWRNSLVAIAPDGTGGVWYLCGKPYTSDHSILYVDLRLFHLSGSGRAHLESPPGGIDLPDIQVLRGEVEASIRVFARAGDTPIVARPSYGSEDYRGIEYAAMTPTNQLDDLIGGRASGHEIAPTSDGGLFLASFNPFTPGNMWQATAYIELYRSNPPAGWRGFSEQDQTRVFGTWYGDIALSTRPDGDAIFYWSQVRGRTGIFAVRANQPRGTSRERAPREPSLQAAVQFRAGVGVVARNETSNQQSIELFDIAGRCRSRMNVTPQTGREQQLPGTLDLPNGVYFARVSSAGWWHTHRVVIVH